MLLSKIACTSKSRVKVHVSKLMAAKRTSRLVTLIAGCILICFRAWPALLMLVRSLFVFAESLLPIELEKRSQT
jgi:hypothetical protein